MDWLYAMLAPLLAAVLSLRSDSIISGRDRRPPVWQDWLIVYNAKLIGLCILDDDSVETRFAAQDQWQLRWPLRLHVMTRRRKTIETT